jgi:hypothetical protein
MRGLECAPAQHETRRSHSCGFHSSASRRSHRASRPRPSFRTGVPGQSCPCPPPAHSFSKSDLDLRADETRSEEEKEGRAKSAMRSPSMVTSREGRRDCVYLDRDPAREDYSGNSECQGRYSTFARRPRALLPAGPAEPAPRGVPADRTSSRSARARAGPGRDEHPRDRAALQTAEGGTIWSQGNLRSRRGSGGTSLVVLRLSADAVPRGDFVNSRSSCLRNPGGRGGPYQWKHGLVRSRRHDEEEDRSSIGSFERHARRSELGGSSRGPER